MTEVASTKTLRPSKVKTLSIIPLWFSKDMEYWKPEHPPPTTPIRRPAGTGSWVAMISRTFAMAAADNVTGVGAGMLGVSVGTVVAVATVRSPSNNSLRLQKSVYKGRGDV